MTFRTALPLAVVLGLYAALVPYAISLIESSTNALFSTVIYGVAVCWSFGLLRYLYNTSKLRFPGPVPLPIFGNCLSLVSKGTVQESIRYLVATHGNVVDLLFIHGERNVLVCDVDFCKVACKSTDRGDLPHGKDWEKDWRARFLNKEVWGATDLDLFGTTNELGWTERRKFLLPAFDQKHVRAMAGKLEIAVQTMLNGIKVEQVIDIKPVFQQYGLEMIHLTSFGSSVSSLPDQGRFIVDFFDNAIKLFAAYQFDPFLFVSVNILPYIGLNPGELERRKAIPVLRKYSRNLIEKEVKRQKKEGELEGGVDNLLGIMAAGLNESFGVENMIDELQSFAFAGYDTTSVTLSNLMHHLALHPVQQKKVQKEIDSVLGKSSDGLATAVKDMPYLAACIRESQRLQPVTPLLKRRLHENVPIKQLDGSKVVIPKGTLILIPLFLLHRDEDQYPDPESFKPERWIDASGSVIPPKPGYYYAFGSGAKMCIGIQLAEREVKMAAAAVLQKFHVESRGEVKIVDNFTTGPEKVLVELKRRD